MVTNKYDLLVLNLAHIHLTEVISNLHFDITLFIFQYFSHGSTNYLIDVGIVYFYFRLYLRRPSSMMAVIFCHCNTSVANGKFYNFNALWTSEIKVLVFREVHALQFGLLMSNLHGWNVWRKSTILDPPYSILQCVI